jgi:hypothetical protein
MAQLISNSNLVAIVNEVFTVPEMSKAIYVENTVFTVRDFNYSAYLSVYELINQFDIVLQYTETAEYVVIETDKRTLIFCFLNGMYKLHYVKENGKLKKLYSLGPNEWNNEKAEDCSNDLQLIVFERQEWNKLYFTFIDTEFEVHTDVAVDIKTQ